MTRLFISRSLSPTSPILKVCRDNAVIVVDESLLHFDPIPFASYVSTDWIFFYSKNGVKFFLEQNKTALDPKIKIGAMGGPTALLVEYSLGRKVDFIGQGPPTQVAEQFETVARHQSVLFIKAKFSRSSVERQISDVQMHELIVYDNTIRDDFPTITDQDVYMFTSPMNANAFLDKYDIPSLAKVIAIGPTTASALAARIDHQIQVAAKPTESALADSLLPYL